jgi:hypothetical protein
MIIIMLVCDEYHVFSGSGCVMRMGLYNLNGENL